VLVAPELIEMLLHTVHAYGSSALTSCLRVCKQWRAIGEPILWRHIYLELTNFETFIAAVARADLRRIHSMTLRFDKIGFSKGYKTLSVKVAAHLLMPRLWSMPNLVSLSCRFTAHEDTLSAAASLLSDLPATIRNLELLSCRLPRPDWDGTARVGMHHLCSWIAVRLPQLQRLRLSDTRVCSTMFTRIKETCPLLDEIIIDGRAGLVPNCITDLPDFHSVLHRCIPRPYLDAFYNSQVRDSLLLRKARVVVIGQRFVSWEETEDAFGYLYTISCIDDITTVYPFAESVALEDLAAQGILKQKKAVSRRMTVRWTRVYGCATRFHPMARKLISSMPGACWICRNIS